MSGDLSDLRPVYLIHGQEDLLLERAVTRLRDRLSAVANVEFNMDVFEGPHAEAEAVVGAANTFPFDSERRLVIVWDVDKMGAEGVQPIVEYCADPAEHTVLVLVARKVARNTRLYKAVDALGGVFEYKALKRSEYPGEVAALFEAKGRTVDREAAEALVAAVGRDLRMLATEVEKVVAHAGDKERLTAEDIREVVAETSPVSVFEFLDALGARDCRESLRLLARLLAEGERLLGVHAMAVRHVRSLLGARALLDRNATKQQMVTGLSRPDWQVRNLVRQAERFREEELVGALEGAALAEEEMKTSRTEPRLAFERWVVSVCEGA
jgi:DNA polymerase-3 subunit delta